MTKPQWVDYSGAAPILLPVSIMHCWKGSYLPVDPDCFWGPDLKLPDGAYAGNTDFDFEHPKTEFDRACALGDIPPVHLIFVGPGYGLVFATKFDPFTWWPEQRMLVNGGSLPRWWHRWWLRFTTGQRKFPNAVSLPQLSRLGEVKWYDELTWNATESEYVLMNACDHGANPDKDPYFNVKLTPGEYVIQWGQYGWHNNDPSLVLFRFVLKTTTPGMPVTEPSKTEKELGSSGAPVGGLKQRIISAAVWALVGAYFGIPLEKFLADEFHYEPFGERLGLAAGMIAGMIGGAWIGTTAIWNKIYEWYFNDWPYAHIAFLVAVIVLLLGFISILVFG